MPSIAALAQGLQASGDVTPQTAAMVQQLLASLPSLTGDRYVAILCFVIAVWEHVLNFDNEQRLIWAQHRYTTTVTRALYIFLRYTVTSLSVLTLIVVCNISTRHDNQLCKIWVITLAIAGNLTLILGNARLIHQAYSLWDARPQTKTLLRVVFFASYSATGAFSIYATTWMAERVFYVDIIVHSCVIQALPKQQKWVWISQMLFDVFIILYTLLNRTHRPQYVTAELITRFRRDCLQYFMCLFVLRLMNLALCSTGNVSFFVLGYLIDFTIVNMIMTRLILRLEFLKLSHNERAGYADRTKPEVELQAISSPSGATNQTTTT